MDDVGGGKMYGYGRAGGAFDPLTYIKKPQVILRIVSWVFSIIVFGCISSSGYVEGKCVYNDDTNACRFGVGIGVIAFLGTIGFLALDALYDTFSNIKQRKHAIIADIVFSGAWAFMFFVAFCYLTNAWNRTDSIQNVSVNNVQAAIAFCFFSIATWAVLCYLAVHRYKVGATASFAPTYESDGTGQPPYSSYPSGGDTGDAYQEPPFSSTKEPLPDYQTPAY